MELLASQVSVDQRPSANSHQIVSPASKRYSITFFPPSAGKAWINNNPMSGPDQGIPLVAGGLPVYLCVMQQGETIQHDWHCVNDAGLHPVSWIDSTAL